MKNIIEKFENIEDKRHASYIEWNCQEKLTVKIGKNFVNKNYAAF